MLDCRDGSGPGGSACPRPAASEVDLHMLPGTRMDHTCVRQCHEHGYQRRHIGLSTIWVTMHTILHLHLPQDCCMLCIEQPVNSYTYTLFRHQTLAGSHAVQIHAFKPTNSALHPGKIHVQSQCWAIFLRASRSTPSGWLSMHMHSIPAHPAEPRHAASPGKGMRHSHVGLDSLTDRHALQASVHGRAAAKTRRSCSQAV